MLLDDGLIILAKAGDENAFLKLYNKAWREVSSILKWRFESICIDDIEDVFHDVMMKFLEDPLAIKAHTDKQFLNWVIVCCKNRILDIIESQYNKRKMPLPTVNEEGEKIPFEIEDPYNLEDEFIKNEIYEHILAKINKLDKVDRRIIILLSNGYSQREISEQLGMSYDNVRQRKRRAIKKISSELNGYFE